MDIRKLIEGRKDTYVEELFKLLIIPSITADSGYVSQRLECARLIHDKLNECGLKNIKIIETKEDPLIYGEWCELPCAPTVLLYGHYDVMPVGDTSLWDSKPFKPVIKNGYIYCRGSSDDKGQLFAILKAMKIMMELKKRYSLNIKVIIEGGEEHGSPAFVDRLNDKSIVDLLSCDFIALSDASWVKDDLPSIEIGLRGALAMEIIVNGPKQELHSGYFGGIVNNPLNVLIRIVSRLQDENGRILIPNFYDDIVPLTDKEKKEFVSVGLKETDQCSEAGVDCLWGEPGYTFIERKWARPSLDVHGIWGGYSGEDIKTSIPPKCGAKITMRLVADQNPQKIEKLLKEYISKMELKGVKVSYKKYVEGLPIYVNPDNKYLHTARNVYKDVFGKKPILVRCGGSIPVFSAIKAHIDVPIIFCNLGSHSDNTHAPNEHFKVKRFLRGIELWYKLLQKWGEEI